LLDGLHEDLNLVLKKPYVEEKEAEGRSDAEVALERWQGFKQRNDSFVVDAFFGLTRSEVRCDAKECSRVSVTFDPQRAFMLPLPAIRTVLVKLTLVYADPKKPLTRYGATVSKTGTVKDVRHWMSERSGIPEELLYCVKLNYHKILTMVNMNAPVKRISDLYEYYVYEVLSQEAIAAMRSPTTTTTTTNDPDAPDAPDAPNAPNAAGKEEEKTPADTDVDEHGVYTLMKCRCKWKSMRGAYYNAEIRGRNKDGTYVKSLLYMLVVLVV